MSVTVTPVLTGLPIVHKVLMISISTNLAGINHSLICFEVIKPTSAPVKKLALYVRTKEVSRVFPIRNKSTIQVDL